MTNFATEAEADRLIAEQEVRFRFHKGWGRPSYMGAGDDIPLHSDWGGPPYLGAGAEVPASQEVDVERLMWDQEVIFRFAAIGVDRLVWE